MHLAVDNATQFFAVVGAPYIAERHLDADRENGWLGAPETRRKSDQRSAADRSSGLVAIK